MDDTTMIVKHPRHPLVQKNSEAARGFRNGTGCHGFLPPDLR